MCDKRINMGLIYDQSLRRVFFSATIASSSVPGGAGLALLPTTLFFLAWAMRCFRAVADVFYEWRIAV